MKKLEADQLKLKLYFRVLLESGNHRFPGRKDPSESREKPRQVPKGPPRRVALFRSNPFELTSPITDFDAIRIMLASPGEDPQLVAW